eukprot:Nk52_evm79s208 gene=Nk52_evmTU79s208
MTISNTSEQVIPASDLSLAHINTPQKSTSKGSSIMDIEVELKPPAASTLSPPHSSTPSCSSLPVLAGPSDLLPPLSGAAAEDRDKEGGAGKESTVSKGGGSSVLQNVSGATGEGVDENVVAKTSSTGSITKSTFNISSVIDNIIRRGQKGVSKRASLAKDKTGGEEKAKDNKAKKKKQRKAMKSSASSSRSSVASDELSSSAVEAPVLQEKSCSTKGTPVLTEKGKKTEEEGSAKIMPITLDYNPLTPLRETINNAKIITSSVQSLISLKSGSTISLPNQEQKDPLNHSEASGTIGNIDKKVAASEGTKSGTDIALKEKKHSGTVSPLTERETSMIVNSTPNNVTEKEEKDETELEGEAKKEQGGEKKNNSSGAENQAENKKKKVQEQEKVNQAKLGSKDAIAKEQKVGKDRKVADLGYARSNARGSTASLVGQGSVSTRIGSLRSTLGTAAGEDLTDLSAQRRNKKIAKIMEEQNQKLTFAPKVSANSTRMVEKKSLSFMERQVLLMERRRSSVSNLLDAKEKKINELVNEANKIKTTQTSTMINKTRAEQKRSAVSVSTINTNSTHPGKKYFTVLGPYEELKTQLKSRGWVENVSGTKSSDFIWVITRLEKEAIKNLSQSQLYNHYVNSGELTRKSHLSLNLNSVKWFSESSQDEFFPKCFLLYDQDERAEFRQEFRLIAAINILRMSQEMDIPFTVVSLAVKACHGYLRRKLHHDTDIIPDEPFEIGERGWNCVLEYSHRLSTQAMKKTVKHMQGGNLPPYMNVQMGPNDHPTMKAINNRTIRKLDDAAAPVVTSTESTQKNGKGNRLPIEDLSGASDDPDTWSIISSSAGEADVSQGSSDPSDSEAGPGDELDCKRGMFSGSNQKGKRGVDVSNRNEDAARVGFLLNEKLKMRHKMNNQAPSPSKASSSASGCSKTIFENEDAKASDSSASPTAKETDGTENEEVGGASEATPEAPQKKENVSQTAAKPAKTPVRVTSDEHIPLVFPYTIKPPNAPNHVAGKIAQASSLLGEISAAKDNTHNGKTKDDVPSKQSAGTSQKIHSPRYLHTVTPYEEMTKDNVSTVVRETLTVLSKVCTQYEINGAKNIWIIKPAGKSRGRGISCSNDFNYIMNSLPTDEKWVVQKYIERPLIIHKRKFDIRHWVLVTDWNPLTIWVYKDCYLRFCSDEFCLAELSRKSIHLTNNSVQRHLPGFNTCSLINENMWELQDFQTFLEKDGKGDLWEKQIYPDVKEMILKSFMCGQDTIENRKGSFELYGIDYILDEKFKPWLVEINSSPQLKGTTTVTDKLCENVIKDLVKVVVDGKCSTRHSDTGDWEVLIRQQSLSMPISFGLDLAVEGQPFAALSNLPYQNHAFRSSSSISNINRSSSNINSSGYSQSGYLNSSGSCGKAGGNGTNSLSRSKSQMGMSSRFNTSTSKIYNRNSNTGVNRDSSKSQMQMRANNTDTSSNKLYSHIPHNLHPSKTSSKGDSNSKSGSSSESKNTKEPGTSSSSQNSLSPNGKMAKTVEKTAGSTTSTQPAVSITTSTSPTPNAPTPPSTISGGTSKRRAKKVSPSPTSTSTTTTTAKRTVATSSKTVIPFGNEKGTSKTSSSSSAASSSTTGSTTSITGANSFKNKSSGSTSSTENILATTTTLLNGGLNIGIYKTSEVLSRKKSSNTNLSTSASSSTTSVTGTSTSAPPFPPLAL